ncbi:MAG: thymidine kinase [Patescibacteria group bacterium]
MKLTLILGPMKSGKSMDLISTFAPYAYTDRPFALFQPVRNVRDEQIHTRNGIKHDAQKVTSLKEALGKGYFAIGVDEGHMFAPEEADVVEQLLKEGTRVVICALDTDPWGELFLIIKRLIELGPDEVRYKRAACEDCRSLDAIYTQVLHNGEPVGRDVPPCLPDDGTYSYKAVCRTCFVRK